MKAFIAESVRKKDGARVGEMPDPELRDDDVLVQVHAAGVNLLDSIIRNGVQAHFALSLTAHFG
jgi:alcohol dehydrogenase